MTPELEKMIMKGEIIDTDALISDIDYIPHDENYVDALATTFTRIALQKPLITRVAQIGPSHLRNYIVENRLYNEVGNSMFNMLALYDKSPVNRELVLLYEMNYGITRSLIHFINELKGENKVPYIYRFLINIYRLKYNREMRPTDLPFLMRDGDLIDYIQRLSKRIPLKKYAGETNTNCRAYDWILGECDIFQDVIVRTGIS